MSNEKEGSLFKLLELEKKPSVKDVRELIDKHPYAVKETNAFGWLPLHHAARYGAPVEVVQLLIDKYPDAVKEKDQYGRLPLHYAAINGALVEVIQLLMKEYPAAVKEKDKDGIFPLHFAVRNEASEDMVKLFTDEYADAVKKKDGFGGVPLHYAAGRRASVKVMQLLMNIYPDAVKMVDGDGDLPLHCATRNGASGEVIQLLTEAYPDAEKGTFFQKLLMRSKGLLGDHAKGKDLLGVSEEAHAIADAIAFKDLETPFVVGIMGGWGSGKSFTFHLIRERLKEIQQYDLTNEVVKRDFPYVGHLYLVMFGAWTFAKLCLWSSLMCCILTELNDQLDLEAAIGQQLLKKGVSVIDLMDQFNTSGKMKYATSAMEDENVREETLEWQPRGGNITKALINAITSNYDNEVKELQEKKQQLDKVRKEFEKVKDKNKQQLAWEVVTAKFNTTFLPEIKKLLKDAYTQYVKDNPDDPVPQTVDAAISSIKRWEGRCGWATKCWDLFWAGRLSPLWFIVFLSSLIFAVVLTLILKKTGAIATAIGPLLSGIFGIFDKFNDAREKLRYAQAEIAKVASEMHLDKEQVQRALEVANGAQCANDNNDEENQQDIIKLLNAEISSLEDRVWLRKGDSLKKVVGDRVGSKHYEEHLGVVHQAQADLKHISDAMMSNDGQIFPRGHPRIVLFIDDLDRCPPEKVVETLEAVQLLVKTKLFVVVLAIDSQYVTLCLEKKYEDILSQEHHPSGLDYVEKIIQLPYRVPPISAEYMKSYLQEKMKKHVESPDPSPNSGLQLRKNEEPQEKTSADEKVSKEPKRVRPNDDTRSPAPMRPDEKKPAKSAIPTEELEFTWKEMCENIRLADFSTFVFIFL